ncbi:MAG: helix-turn-helix transcriptional regulator [Myxococcales bacterium]|nr:helix-turn-helix transcriptional regulator [Myxococcales bacterium]
MSLDPRALRRLCEARELLRDASASSITIAALAQRAGLSTFHFIRRFEAVFGEAPNRYRTRWRIERARELLAGSGRSVTEICLEVGYTSLGSFSALFTRRVGVSPSTYRRQTRPLVQVPGPAPSPLTPGCLTLLGLLPPTALRNPGEAASARIRHTRAAQTTRRSPCASSC